MLPSSLGEINLCTLRGVLRKIAATAEFVMLYWMGEPLLHTQFVKALEIVRQELDAKIVLSTNATLMTSELAAAIHDTVDITLCSLDRWNAKAFENIRRGANFNTVCRNIEMLLAEAPSDRGTEVVVKALDINLEASEYDSFYRHWSSRGARPIRAWLNDWAGSLPSVRNAASLQVPRSDLDRVPCADLWFKMVVNWRGDVQMCCFDWQYEHRIGSLSNNDTTVRSIWHGSEMKRLREAHVERKFDVTDLCGTCGTWAEPREHDAYIDFQDDSYFIVF